MATQPSVSVVTERGQVSIPAQLRKDLGLEKGRRLFWEKSGEQEIRVVVLPDAEPRGAMAMRGFARTFRSTRSSEDWMKELREGED